MDSARNVQYTISLKDMFSDPMRKAEQQAGHFEKKLESSTDKLAKFAKAGALLYGLKMAFSAISDFVHEFDAAEQATAQLNATLQSTHNAAGVSVEALNKQAEALSKITRYDDDAITGMESLLLTFTNIKGAIVSEAIPAVLDLSTKMGQDLNTTVVQVGKALQDPIQGINALKRVGVSFSTEQKKVIETMVKTGDVAGAQRMILKELTTEFGGAAEASGKAGTGPMVIFQNQLKNIKEELGGVVVTVSQMFMPMLESLASGFKAVADWAREHPELMRAIAFGITAVAVAIGVVTAATWAFNAALDANPIVWVIVALAALAAAIYYAYQKCETFRKILNAIGEVFKFIWKIIKFVLDILKAIGGAIYDLLDSIGVIDAMKAAFEGLGMVFSWVWRNFFKPMIDGFDILTHKIKVANMTMKLWMGGMDFDAAAKLADHGIAAEEYLAKQRDKAADADAGIGDFMDKPSGGGTGIPPAGGGGGGATLPSSSVSGKTPTTINITIGSLIGKFETHVQNFTQSTTDAAEQLSKALIGVVNDANRIQT